MRLRGFLVAVLASCGGAAAKKMPTPVKNVEPSTAPSDTGAAGSARLIGRAPRSGVLELTGDRAAAMKDADRSMAAHCGANAYTITQEGEEVVGEEFAAGPGDQPATMTAWRVHYVCAK